MTIREAQKIECQQIIDEVSSQSGVYVLEAENSNYHYISFVYNGYLFYIQSSLYYPFTDINSPGKWIYTVSDITGINEKAQLTYFEAYTGFSDLKINRPHNKPLTTGQKINVLLNNAERVCKQVIAQHGSTREKEFISNGAFMAKGSTWNNEHKVVEILSKHPDLDGYYPGFQIDIVTKSICG